MITNFRMELFEALVGRVQCLHEDDGLQLLEPRCTEQPQCEILAVLSNRGNINPISGSYHQLPVLYIYPQVGGLGLGLSRQHFLNYTIIHVKELSPGSWARHFLKSLWIAVKMKICRARKTFLRNSHVHLKWLMELSVICTNHHRRSLDILM